VCLEGGFIQNSSATVDIALASVNNIKATGEVIEAMYRVGWRVNASQIKRDRQV